MNPAVLSDVIDGITGTWKPTATATLDDLAKARKNLAAALASGIPAEAVHATSAFHTHIASEQRSVINSIVEGIVSHPSPLNVFPNVRSLTDIDPALAASVAGMKIDQTFGPFIDSFGVLHWIDLIPIPKKIPISSATRGELGFLIVKDPNKATLNAGSLWIGVKALDVPMLLSGVVGLSFVHGTAKKTGNVNVSNTGITIGAGGTLELDLTLAPPTPPTGTPPIGDDARTMTLNLPVHVTIKFTEAGVAFTAIDDSSATVYGTGFSLRRNVAKPQVATVGFGYVLFPCDVSIPEFEFNTVLSTEVVPSAKPVIQGGGWALPITTAPAAQLGEAASAGSLVLKLGAGAFLNFGNLPTVTPLASATLALSPGTITIAAANGARDVTDRLTLWNPAPPSPLVEPPPTQHDSEIDLTIRHGVIIFCVISTSVEVAIFFGSARVNIDRPLAANGARLPVLFDSALAGFVRISAGKYVIAEMSDPSTATTKGVPRRWAIALENALLSVAPATSAILVAAFSGTRLVGFLELNFEGARVHPTLPDPYASGDVVPIEISGSVTALDTWTLNPGSALTFAVAPSAQVRAKEGRAAFVEFGTTLLDLSSNVDQFGVSIAPLRDTPFGVSFEGLTIAVPQQQLLVYTLPGISWEPVVDDTTENWYNAPSDNDGPPTRLVASSVQLVAVEPGVALTQFAEAAANTQTFGQFTLPFGLMATLETTPQGENEPTFTLLDTKYPNQLSTARQLSIQATGPQNISILPQSTSALPGGTTTGTPIDLSILSYGGLILSDTDPRLSATAFVEKQFSLQAGALDPEIPVSRIDISGYGTSMFSDWANPDIHFTGVARSRFDVIVGRTAYELVQIQTVILPWTCRITETIIFERFDTGLVVRHNTGWKAVGDAAFEVFAPNQVFLGAVQKLSKIQNIVPTNGTAITIRSIDPDPNLNGRTLEFVPVTFDADVVLQSNVIATVNGSDGNVVAATQLLGYAQATPGPGASAIETLQLMQQLPSGVSGLLQCILKVGPPPGGSPPPLQFTLNVSSINVKGTNVTASGEPYPAAVGVAAFGTPRLPRDGAWSITKRGQGDTAPTAVDATAPIPLISVLDASNNPQWRLLDPSDALSGTNPGTVFGLLQGTGTSKTLFENPVVQQNGQALSLDPSQGVPQPNLADIGALLGAVDIFPALSNALQIPAGAGDALQLVQDGFRKTFSWTIQKSGGTSLDDQKLLDLGIISIVLQYHGPDPSNNNQDTNAKATFTVDATATAPNPRWSLEIDFLSLAVFAAGFGTDPLLTIHGGFQASETQKAGFTNIAVDYGGSLSAITGLLQGLKGVVTAIGGSVDLDVGFSNNKLTVRDGFALPTMPLGLGELENIALDLGLSVEIPKSADFTVGFGSKEKPFTWIVDPLAGNGAIVLATQDGDLGVFIEAGIGAALALDVAVASGSASIILDFSLSIKPADIQICIALTGNATVDVLDGLASASLTLTAAIAVDLVGSPPNEADFTGAVAVGIHISIAWVISVDFDGSWSFSESLPLHALPI